jgi:hypothetical protein
LRKVGRKRTLMPHPSVGIMLKYTLQLIRILQRNWSSVLPCWDYLLNRLSYHVQDKFWAVSLRYSPNFTHFVIFSPTIPNSNHLGSNNCQKSFSWQWQWGTSLFSLFWLVLTMVPPIPPILSSIPSLILTQISAATCNWHSSSYW